ncbi:hypothetical protein VRRI112168_19405 [Vreelandella rituensis]|nr:hypothetical protein [Halomonas rituensis]
MQRPITHGMKRHAVDGLAAANLLVLAMLAPRPGESLLVVADLAR